MKKKIVAIILASTMVLGMGLSASAAATEYNDIGHENTSIDLGGTVSEPTISVKITKGDAIIANPYGMSIATRDTEGANTLEGSTFTIENASNIPVGIALSGKITPADSEKAKYTLGTTKAAVEAAKTKQIYLQAEVIKTATPKAKLQKVTAKVASGSTTYTYADVAPYVYGATEKAYTDVVVLATTLGSASAEIKAKADLNGDAKAQSVAVIDVVLTGATSTPADTKWTSDDAFTVTTVFDIQMAKKANISAFAIPAP